MKIKLLFIFTVLILVSVYGVKISRAEKSLQDNVFSSKTFFNQRCIACHSQDGKPKKEGTPDFTSSDFQSTHTDEQIKASITNGKIPRMPPFRSLLNSGQVDQMVVFIREFGPKKTEEDKKQEPNSSTATEEKKEEQPK